MIPNEVCQACGQGIMWGDKVIAVRFGTITRKKHTSISKDYVDYFHQRCCNDIAIRRI